MAVSQVSETALASSLFNDTANAATAIAVKASSSTIYYIEADNTANAAVTYLKLWNTAAGSVVVGTTAPDMVLPLLASTKHVFVFPGGTAFFSSALSCASVTTAGTAGTTPPTTPITVRIAYT